ncbi:hypothetical protein [Nafulsella turpanensis]|uniref:hypothetical protein n=1 Tax=Nafulsella turpanensis TaxID=1265690 RepID=UPI000346036D|nr:hypothetical protein [Nafulsella turpanensis]
MSIACLSGCNCQAEEEDGVLFEKKVKQFAEELAQQFVKKAQSENLIRLNLKDT